MRPNGDESTVDAWGLLLEHLEDADESGLTDAASILATGIQLGLAISALDPIYGRALFASSQAVIEGDLEEAREEVQSTHALVVALMEAVPI